jgi:hypothetical protein
MCALYHKLQVNHLVIHNYIMLSTSICITYNGCNDGTQINECCTPPHQLISLLISLQGPCDKCNKPENEGGCKCDKDCNCINSKCDKCNKPESEGGCKCDNNCDCKK